MNSLHRVLLLSLSFAFILILNACSTERASPKTLQQTLYVFGTEVKLLVVETPERSGQKAINEIEQAFQDFHYQWHAWEPGGIISQINQAIAHNQPIEVTDSVKSFIETTQQLSAQTDYLFDPAIGQLIKMWGFHSENWQGPPPSETQRQTWLAQRPSIADIYFENYTLMSRNAHVQLDFGGNAKGLALNIAMDILRRHQIEHALVNIGGDLQALGNKLDHQAWSIGIQNPNNLPEALARIEVKDGDSVFTSGTYQRFYKWQDEVFSHIINPNTAWPANSFASVTVMHSDPILADTAATALLIAGPENWQKIAQQMQLDKVLLVTRDQQIIQTPAMQIRTELLAN